MVAEVRAELDISVAIEVLDHSSEQPRVAEAGLRGACRKNASATFVRENPLPTVATTRTEHIDHPGMWHRRCPPLRTGGREREKRLLDAVKTIRQIRSGRRLLDTDGRIDDLILCDEVSVPERGNDRAGPSLPSVGGRDEEVSGVLAVVEDGKGKLAF